MNKMELVQKPVIKHQLKEIGAEVTVRLKALGIKNLVATEENVKSLKTLRADLTKEITNYEEQRKFIKKELNSPYTEFENLYKIEIADKYKNAVDTLKGSISSIEEKIKDKKKANIEAYFDELCASEKIDFLKFSAMDLDIKLSITEKAYKQQCNDFVLGVKDDLELIESQEFSVEILVEYKETLKASKAITDVLIRKEREKEELEREKQKEYLRRSKVLQSIKMVPDKDTGTYVYSNDIYVVWDKVKDVEKEVFETIVIEFDEKIKSVAIEEKKEPEQKKAEFKEPIKTPKVAPPLQAPVEEKKEETVNVKWQISGTLSQLMKMKQYFLDNNLTYKNL